MQLLSKLLLALVLVSGASAQSFTIKPTFTEGQHVVLEVAQRRADRGRRFVATSTVTIDVERSDESGALLTIESSPSTIQGAPEEVRASIRAAERALVDTVLRARFNPAGEFEGLENEAEVVAAVERAMEDMVDAMSAQVSSAEAMEKVRAMVSELITPDAALDSATEFIHLYFGMAGVAVSPGEVERARVQLPSPFGGTLDADIEMRVAQMDAGLNQAVLRVVSRPTPESATAAVAALVRQMMPEGAGPRFDAALARTRLSIVDRAEYLLDLPTHWMRSVDFARTMSVNGVERVNQTTIRIVRVGPER